MLNMLGLVRITSHSGSSSIVTSGDGSCCFWEVTNHIGIGGMCQSCSMCRGYLQLAGYVCQLLGGVSEG